MTMVSAANAFKMCVAGFKEEGKAQLTKEKGSFQGLLKLDGCE